MDLSEAQLFLDAVLPTSTRERVAYLIDALPCTADVEMSNRAFSYIRFSSVAQERGDSLRRQTTLAENYALKNNLILDTSSYRDLGLSAFKKQNLETGNLGVFLKAVDSGVIPPGSMLLVENLDRISRAQVDEALELFLSIIRRGITIVTLQDEQVYSTERIKQDKGISLIISITYMMRAHEESATKSKRVSAAWRNKRENGKILTGMGPPWLRLSEDRTTWHVLKDEVAKVKLIFDLSLKGNGAPTIARQLNGQGVKPFRSESWSNGTVQHVLGNKSVIGTFIPKNGEPPVDGYFPAIIDEALFWSVQDGMQARRWKGSSNETAVTNLFTGLCFCHCGTRMRFVASAKPRYYLLCSKAYSNAGCSGQRHPYRDISMNGLEREILMWLHLDMELTYPHLQTHGSDASGKRVLEGQLALKKEQLDTMITLMQAGSKRGAHEVIKLEGEIEVITEQLRQWSQPAMQSALDSFNESLSLMQDMNIEKNVTTRNDMRRSMRSSLQRLIDQIVFLDGVETKPKIIGATMGSYLYHKTETTDWRTVLIQLKGQSERHRLQYPLPG